MSNIFGTPEKVANKARLFEIGLDTLTAQGWTIDRIAGTGKSSVRKITKGNVSKVVSIRTSQDTYISFQRNKDNTSWVTLPDVDIVVAVSVNDYEKPKFAQVHMIDGRDMLERFDRAYAARLAAGNVIRPGHGVWISLYDEDSSDQLYHVGGGAGRDNPPISRVPLKSEDLGPSIEPLQVSVLDEEKSLLTISEAKRRLAITLGVDPSNIKILVEA